MIFCVAFFLPVFDSVETETSGETRRGTTCHKWPKAGMEPGTLWSSVGFPGGLSGLSRILNIVL